MFTKSLQRILDEIIGKTFNNLRFNLLGPDRVSKAYVLSLRGSRYNPNTSIGSAYIHANALNTTDPSSIDKKTINRIIDVAEEYVNNLEQKSTADISRVVSQWLAEIETKAKLENKSGREVLLSDYGADILKKMKKDLSEQKTKIDKAAASISEYERHNAYNFGAMDGIITAARSVGILDPVVFKILVDDEKLCKYCQKLWLNADGRPKLYYLSELSASPGSNYKTPLPSIQPTHINCRCILVTLLPGFGLDAAGKIVYKGIDPDTKLPWNELARQRAGK